MDNEVFQNSVNDYISTRGKEGRAKLAARMEVGLSSVDRWARGQSRPLSRMKKVVVEEISGLILEESLDKIGEASEFGPRLRSSTDRARGSYPQDGGSIPSGGTIYNMKDELKKRYDIQKSNAEGRGFLSLHVVHRFWWVFHNVVVHPLCGLLPFKWTFRLHDWSTDKLY